MKAKCNCGKDILKYEWHRIKKRFNEGKQEWEEIEEEDELQDSAYHCEDQESCCCYFEPCIACDKLIDVYGEPNAFSFSGDDGIICKECSPESESADE